MCLCLCVFQAVDEAPSIASWIAARPFGGDWLPPFPPGGTVARIAACPAQKDACVDVDPSM